MKFAIQISPLLNSNFIRRFSATSRVLGSTVLYILGFNITFCRLKVCYELLQKIIPKRYQTDKNLILICKHSLILESFLCWKANKNFKLTHHNNDSKYFTQSLRLLLCNSNIILFFSFKINQTHSLLFKRNNLFKFTSQSFDSFHIMISSIFKI